MRVYLVTLSVAIAGGAIALCCMGAMLTNHVYAVSATMHLSGLH